MYSKEKIVEIHHATKHLNKLFSIGVMSIASYKDVFFLHNEMPGTKMSDKILQQLEAVKDDKIKTRELSLKLSGDLIDIAHEYLSGLYIITSFQNIEDSLELAACSGSITTHKEAML